MLFIRAVVMDSHFAGFQIGTLAAEIIQKAVEIRLAKMLRIDRNREDRTSCGNVNRCNNT
ncbi:hypothetical protein SLH49_00145 [Cognatiyoonia sp. IB215446]|uniref:hypothetical protein n=1 Tax=Cognatiyoonia sp. IB215446 TaxID=3097355 RepID=UPI002A0F85D9|nr:hypothetical protein [Cognatiyoonia sp. IB215446]MDX8346385.1 hypothetical protein [Cognatiyoonia sp. IB215446]